MASKPEWICVVSSVGPTIAHCPNECRNYSCTEHGCLGGLSWEDAMIKCRELWASHIERELEKLETYYKPY